jgi:hypothetical protein
LDQLYSRTETPDASDAGGPLPAGASADSTVSAGIMSALPRRRPQRRSTHRHPGIARGTAVVAAQAIEPEPAEDPRPHLRAVADGATTTNKRRRSKSRRPSLPPPKEPAPGIHRLAFDGMVETAKFPWRVAAEVARQAAGSMAGTLRR